jgi:hypothetical protein
MIAVERSIQEAYFAKFLHGLVKQKCALQRHATIFTIIVIARMSVIVGVAMEYSTSVASGDPARPSAEEWKRRCGTPLFSTHAHSHDVIALAAQN